MSSAGRILLRHCRRVRGHSARCGRAEPVREQAGRVGNQARVPLGVAIQDITFQDLIHLGPQSKVFRVCRAVVAKVVMTQHALSRACAFLIDASSKVCSSLRLWSACHAGAVGWAEGGHQEGRHPHVRRPGQLPSGGVTYGSGHAPAHRAAAGRESPAARSASWPCSGVWLSRNYWHGRPGFHVMHIHCTT